MKPCHYTAYREYTLIDTTKILLIFFYHIRNSFFKGVLDILIANKKYRFSKILYLFTSFHVYIDLGLMALIIKYM